MRCLEEKVPCELSPHSAQRGRAGGDGIVPACIDHERRSFAVHRPKRMIQWTDTPIKERPRYERSGLKSGQKLACPACTKKSCVFPVTNKCNVKRRALVSACDGALVNRGTHCIYIDASYFKSRYALYTDASYDIGTGRFG